MGVRRYSRDPRIQRRQELFDDLQRRVGVDYYAPSIGELAEAGVTRTKLVCRDYACLHRSVMPLDLTQFPAKMRTHTLRKMLFCQVCRLRRPRLELIWDGP
jgi:hypothetical protein